MRDDMRRELRVVRQEIEALQTCAQTAIEIEMGIEIALLQLVQVLTIYYLDREVSLEVKSILNACNMEHLWQM